MGVFGSSHGIKGFIKVFTEGETLHTLKAPATCTVEDPQGKTSTIAIEEFRPNGNHFLVKIKGYETPETVVKYLTEHKNTSGQAPFLKAIEDLSNCKYLAVNPAYDKMLKQEVEQEIKQEELENLIS